MQWKILASLFVLCLSMSFYSCGSDTDSTDGDNDIAQDGDIENEDETDGDMEDDSADEDIISENEVDETDGDMETTDGDSELVDSEDEALSCENPYPIPTEKWEPENKYADVDYKQEQGFLFDKGELAGKINEICKLDSSNIYAATDMGIYKINEAGESTFLEAWGSNVFDKITTDGESLFASYQDTLFIGDETGPLEQTTAPNNIDKIIITNNTEAFIIDSTKAVGRVVRSSKNKAEASINWYTEIAELGVNDLCKVGDLLYLATENGLKSFNVNTKAITSMIENEENWPTTNLTAITCDSNGPKVVALKDKGLAFLGDDATFINGADGLPYLSVIAIKGDLSNNGEKLLLITDPVAPEAESKTEGATGFGLITVVPDFTENTSHQWEYYHSRYWIPDNIVLDAVATDENHLFVATSTGLGLIKGSDITLEEKAEVLDLGQYERHNRFGMFSRCALDVPGDLSSARTVDDDNDGQWTNQYLASQSFRYAVTKSETAKNYADEAANAMIRLLTITGKKGFFARSVLEPDSEAAEGEECDYIKYGEWHLSPDKQWCWKGDTSKDEYVGHIFGLSLYYDLVADDTQKKKVRDAFVDLHDGIIDVGYYLEDVDGECTTHGQLDPGFMEILGIFGDAGLNGASILGGLLATYHMSGEQRFMDAFNYLAFDEGYADYVRRIEEINLMVHLNHDSEEMSFLAMATLMRYETEPCLMAMWREGLEYLWEVQRPEKDPEFNMIYAWLSRNETNDLENSIATLQQMHMNGIKWTVNNSHRADYTLNPKLDRFDHEQSMEVFSYKQKVFPRWSENPYRLDYQNSGTSEEMLQTWLLPYWLGRYLGLIVPAEK